MKTFASPEGNISYTVQGEGDLTFLLIHNSGGNHEMMLSTASHYASRGKVLVPDLLGHGSSDSPDREYPVKLFAEGLIELCKYERVEQLVCIGLNYGANVGIEMAHIFPPLVSHLILIEPPLLMEPWVVELVEQQIKDLENPQEGWAEVLVDSVMKRSSQKEQQIALRALKMTPPYVKASTFKHLLLWDAQHPFSFSLPTLMVQTSHPFCTEEKGRSLFSQLHVGRVVGSGPWANLEVPDQVHPMIDRFLEIHPPSSR